MIKDVGMAVQMARSTGRIPSTEQPRSRSWKKPSNADIEKDFTLLYRDYEKVAKTRL